ncbi:MAG: PQQ-binding-like beta-propeller repeat protein, partial [Planctomycetes bacterium]|nr:PQQ-binding-like beta-propeller repeat protein [Planctomycetota bacterium]
QTKLNGTFFDDIAWQKPTSGQSEGSGMIFFDGVGPDGADLVCLGQSSGQRQVTAVDRHTGAILWEGGPTGGTNIGKDTGAFSNDGTVFYMVSDISTAHLYAWETAVGPGTSAAPLWWDSSSDPNEDAISMRNPVVAPDGRIFLHRWNNKVSAARDYGTKLKLDWLASYDTFSCMSDVSLYNDQGSLKVIASGRRRRVVAFDGDTGAELWQYNSGQVTDATVTIDPENGNIYLHAGFDGDTYIIGLDKDGNQLADWPDEKVMVRDWVDGVNNKHESHSTGCLSHDGNTYYFQTDSDSGDGLLFAINTADGTVKWTYETNNTTNNIDRSCSPIVTING